MGNSLLGMLKGATNSQQQSGLPTSIDDPRLDSAKQYVAQHGGNAKQAFLQLCKERMLNPAEIINRVLGL